MAGPLPCLRSGPHLEPRPAGPPPTLPRQAGPQDTYVGDGATVRDGTLGRHPRAGDPLGDASSWNRAQGRP